MDRDSTVRNAMYEAIGAAGEAAMPLVLQALSDSDETVRYRGCSQPARSLRRLTLTLNCRSQCSRLLIAPYCRSRSSFADWSVLGGQADDWSADLVSVGALAVPALVQTARYGSDWSIHWAIRTLSEMRATPAEVQPIAINTLLHADDWSTCSEAARFLYLMFETQ